MSDTPRTDAALSTPKVVLTDGRYCYTEPWSGAVSGDFARTLEREIAELKAEIAGGDESPSAIQSDLCWAVHRLQTMAPEYVRELEKQLVQMTAARD